MVHTILAIDYGTSRIGLAISRGSLAEPYGILSQDDDVIAVLRQLCQKERISLLLVGVSEGEMAVASQKFGKMLESSLQIPVAYADETLSSHQAAMVLRQNGQTSWKRQHVDAVAAAVFLEAWLDEHPELTRG